MMPDAQLRLLIDADAPASSTSTNGDGVIRISFSIVGRPQQVGSKHALVVKTRNGPKAVALEMNRKKSEPWMQAVRDAAAAVLPQGFELLRGPVEIRVTFAFARPKGHFHTGRKAGDVKRAAPHWHSSTPDLDKLCRSIGDALTGVVLADDRQIATWQAHKVYTAGTEGATVEIRELLQPLRELLQPLQPNEK